MSHPTTEPDGEIALTDALIGGAYRIGSIDLAGALGDRLVELGLTHEAPVRILRRAPLGGPFQLRVRDFVLTLRAEHVGAIRVTPQYAGS